MGPGAGWLLVQVEVVVGDGVGREQAFLALELLVVGGAVRVEASDDLQMSEQRTQPGMRARQ